MTMKCVLSSSVAVLKFAICGVNVTASVLQMLDDVLDTKLFFLIPCKETIVLVDL